MHMSSFRPPPSLLNRLPPSRFRAAALALPVGRPRAEPAAAALAVPDRRTPALPRPDLNYKQRCIIKVRMSLSSSLVSPHDRWMLVFGLQQFNMKNSAPRLIT
jgi:hypothetical protein